MYIYKYLATCGFFFLSREYYIGFPEKQTGTLKSNAINLKDSCLFPFSFVNSQLVSTIASFPCDYVMQPTFVEHF